MRFLTMAVACVLCLCACERTADAVCRCRVPVIVEQAPVAVTMQAIPVELRTIYSTRWRPFFGGWVTRPSQAWVPVASLPAPTAAEPVPAPEPTSATR